MEHNRAQAYTVREYNNEVAVCEILVACTIIRVQISDAYSETDVK